MKAKNQNIVNKSRTPLEKVIPLSSPYAIAIDPSNLCNFKCNFCAMQYSTEVQSYKKQLMDFELYKKIIDDLTVFPKKLKVLRINGQGEPLLNKNLPQMIKYAKEKNISEYIEIITNGSLLNPELNRALVDSGVDRIRISVEALSENKYKEIANATINFEKFVENIKDLYEHRNSVEIYIKIVDVAVPTEEEKKKFFNIFGDICDTIFIDSVIPLWSDFELDNLKTQTGVHGQEIVPVKICPFVFYQCIVNPDGQVTACCADWKRKLILGDLTKDSFQNIWNGDTMKNFWIDMASGKKDKYEMCRKCLLPTYDCNDNIDEYGTLILDNLIAKTPKGA